MRSAHFVVSTVTYAVLCMLQVRGDGRTRLAAVVVHPFILKTCHMLCCACCRYEEVAGYSLFPHPR
jgi:hypothetical protein